MGIYCLYPVALNPILAALRGVMMLVLDDVSLGYPEQNIVKHLSFSLEAGQICAVVGHNGAGKSTLIRTLLGLQPPLTGTVKWPGGKPRTIAYLGQSAELDNQFPIRVKDVVSMGIWQGLDFWTGLDKAASDKVTEALARTGLTHMADRPLYECSSGQLQRCFFARAIVQDAPLLLLDEPFSAIDQTTEAGLTEIIREWRTEGRAVIIVIHDLSTAMAVSDSCLLLGGGRACFGKTTDILTTDNLLAYHYLSETQAEFLSLLQNSGGSNV